MDNDATAGSEADTRKFSHLLLQGHLPVANDIAAGVKESSPSAGHRETNDGEINGHN